MDIANLVEKLKGKLSEDAFEISNKLAEIGSEEVKNQMVQLLECPNLESRIIAARTLSLTPNNSDILETLLIAINHKDNESIVGDLVMFLENFDLSQHYVDVFKLYLFGSFKVSTQAKDFIDHKEFDVTPRVLKKVKKHWNHYTNNVKHDELFDLTKIEVSEILDDLESYISSN